MEMVGEGLSEMEPLPDWISYLTTAESMHCPPWELFEDVETPPGKRWWRITRMMLDAGRAEGERQRSTKRG